VKRQTFLAVATLLVALLILAPSALAQDVVPGDDDPYSAEQNVMVVGSHPELEKAVGRQLPQQAPDEPIDEPGGPAPKSGTLPKSGGVVSPTALLLPAAALLLVASALGYAVLRRPK
jgi:hypothetical protein